MKKLDKYILKKFLVTFVYAVILLSAVVCIVDFAEKNDDFIENDVGYGTVFYDYYLNFIPYFIAKVLGPITIFIAAVFVAAKMAAHTEIIAILSSGISFVRMMVPYILGAILVGVLTFVAIGWIIPQSNKKRIAFELEYLQKNKNDDQRNNIHLQIAPGTYIELGNYSSLMKTGYKFRIDKVVNNEVVERFKTNKIAWDDKKGVWHMENYSLRTFDGDKELITYGGATDTALNLSPGDLKQTWSQHETFTLSELDDFIDLQRSRGAENIEVYLTEKYERIAYPFTLLVLTALGVIIAARKSREGPGLKIAFGFLLAFIYIMFVTTSRTISQNGAMSAPLAAFLPTIVFSGVAVLLYRFVPK